MISTHTISKKPRKQSDTLMSVKELVETLGINIQTVRYYEREGLIPEPERTGGGHRLFSEDDVTRLRFIQHAKVCGFTLREIRELLSLRGSDVATCTDVRVQAEKKLDETEAKLASLNKLRDHLKQLIEDCPGGDVGVDCCNIIRDLENGRSQ